MPHASSEAPARRPDALARFKAGTRAWFQANFQEPTLAQRRAWPAIARKEHVLLCAPTGSGKTLAAFLWALDRLSAGPREGGTRVVYVSPLKALSYDIERNLRAPLRGIGAEVTVGVRTGDTPARERAAMARKPPDILITTPESLYLILGSQARAMLATVECVIVDEIHAVAAAKRGTHLALTLERLQWEASAEVQRIGLSATQTPLEEVGRFLVGPRRKVTLIDTALRKPLDLRIHVPVESMAEPGGGGPLDPLAGGESTRGSIWPAIYPELLRLVREHHSTIVFVNNRRSAERVALRLNELAEEEIARAHHGSLSREERTVVEEQLKRGELPCLVATSSLELGIDMGAVGLVLQIESPKSVARGLQRIGRAGHGVADVSKGRIFPKFRGDLLECAVVCRRMREGAIEPTVVPRNALDVLAQQIVAIAASAGEQGVDVEELYDLVTSTHSYSELGRPPFEGVLDMLDGRYPSNEFGELRPRIVWDRLGGRIVARRGARQLAVANAGTIPDRGLYSVTLPDGRRVGELDEEMVYEARPGQVFLLGASSWRIEEIGRDRVIVTPAPGVPGAVPFWKGEGVGRPKELGAAIGAFARWAVEQDEQTLVREYDLDERAARNLLDYLREQRSAVGALPSDRTIVLERFRDEIGDWRLCVLSPFGGRVHAAWSLAISARVRELYGVEAEAIFSDDGVIVRLPDVDMDAPASASLDAEGRVGAPGEAYDHGEAYDAGNGLAPPSDAELVLFDPEDVQEQIVGELGGSALFGARFRENAARALLIPRAYPGRRTPLWQQRLKSQALLEVARRHRDFPIVLETYRECLRDVLDVPGLIELLRALQTRELSLVEVETPTASPFASSLLFDYVATYMYEGDTPSAERRAAALSLDRDLLRELLGMEDLRELIDPGALEALEDELSCCSPEARAEGPDALAEVLRRVGDLRLQEICERVAPGLDAQAALQRLQRERRVAPIRIGGEERFIATDDAGLYRDALGVAPPSGLPDAFLADVPHARAVLVARYAQTHGPFAAAQLLDRYGMDFSGTLGELERSGALVRGELRPGGSGREWCDPEVLRRLRRASIAALRKEIEPVDARTLVRFLPAWHGIDASVTTGSSRSAVERLREALVPLQGLALPVRAWERDVLARRIGSYSPAWMDALCASGEVVWVGAGALGRDSGRVALYFREDAALLGPPAQGRSQAQEPGPDALQNPEHTQLRELLSRGPCFFTDMLVALEVEGALLAEALWDLVWAGEVTNDAWAPLRALGAGASSRSPAGVGAARAHTQRLRPSSAGSGSGLGLGVPAARVRAARGTLSARSSLRGGRGAGAGPLQGRWSLTRSLFAADVDPARRRRAQAELLLRRHGLLTREQVSAEGVPGGFSAIYGALSELETLGVCRRGYFVEGLGGAQFALPGAVERLRCSPKSSQAELVLAAIDPAQPYGATLPWPRRERNGRGPARVEGAYVVLVDTHPVLYLERGGRSLLTLRGGGSAEREDASAQRPAAEMPLDRAVRALGDAIRAGRVGRVALERVDGEPAIGSPLHKLLVDAGFQVGPRRLTLRA